ncbi:MAG: WHG domain-containing protein [Tabrizicola sp.]|nr:WHG domain-containing protein [Tabrizicola sp.]
MAICAARFWQRPRRSWPTAGSRRFTALCRQAGRGQPCRPAHHFGDVGGLLTALAAEGFRRFLACQHRREAGAARDPVSQLVAAGLGYVDFALDRPALFRLIFASDRPDKHDPELMTAGRACYSHLRDQIKALDGDDADTAAAWAMAHGLADLMMSGRLTSIHDLPPDARDAALEGLIRRVMPAG